MSRIQRVVSIVSFLWIAPAVWGQSVSVSSKILEQDWGEEVHCYAGAPKKESLRLLHNTAKLHRGVRLETKTSRLGGLPAER